MFFFFSDTVSRYARDRFQKKPIGSEAGDPRRRKRL